MVGIFLLVEQTIAGDDDQVVSPSPCGGSAVDADDAGTPPALEGIRFKAVPLVTL